jgi:phosphoglycolate phosphatase
VRYDVVLFDLDGTLTDPYEGITGSYRYALALAGYPVSDDVDLSWVIGPGIWDNLDRLGVPPSEADTVVAAYRERHLAVGLYQAVVIPGIAQLVADLDQAGVRLALATAKTQSQGRATLVHFGLDTHFAVIGGAPEHAPATKGEVVADVLERLGDLDLARVVMVGDRRHDVDGAHENGLAAVGVGWGFAADGELEIAGADHLVATVVELRALLLE